MAHPALHKWDFKMLDSAVDDAIDRTVETRQKMIPFLMEIRDRLSAQGRRNDLKDTPDMTFGDYLETKRDKLGMAPSTIRLLLRSGDTVREKKPPITVSGSPSAETADPVPDLEGRAQWAEVDPVPSPPPDTDVPKFAEFADDVYKVTLLVAGKNLKEVQKLVEPFGKTAALKDRIIKSGLSHVQYIYKAESQVEAARDILDSLWMELSSQKDDSPTPAAELDKAMAQVEKIRKKLFVDFTVDLP